MLEDLVTILEESIWFERVGQGNIQGSFVKIATLAPWGQEASNNRDAERVADQMNWLPSSRDQNDPIHGRSLEIRAEAIGLLADHKKRALDICKVALTSLRRFDGNPRLIVGPHDFSEAARAAAVFAARRAAHEILLREPGFWCRAMEIYHLGHWPCGILPSNRLVVY